MPDDLKYSDPECQHKHITASVKTPVDPDATIDVECFMSTDSVDADDEVMLPDGVELSRFNKNPVVMLCHAIGQPGCFYPLPVGKALWTKQAKRGVLAGVRFSRDTEMGRQVKSLFDEGMLRSFSVGFRPLQVSMMSRKEADSRPDWKEAFERTKGQIRVYRKWHMVELSVAPVPSNPDALVTSYKAKGILVPDWLKPSLNTGKTMPTNTTPATPGGGDSSDPSEAASISRFDLAAKAIDGEGGIAASEVTPADARVMIGLAVPADVAASLAIEGGEPAEELHVTLCYLGRAIEIGTNAISRIEGMCRSLASWGPSLRGSVSGVGRFSASSTSDGQDVIYASVDIPALSSFRECLAREVQCQNVQYSRAHGFTPHITLAYVAPDAETPIPRITPTPIEFNSLSLWVDGERTDFPINPDNLAFGVPVMAWRSVADRLTKAMGDGGADADPDEDKACTCGKAECEKCNGKEGMATKEEEAETSTEPEPDPDDFDEEDEEALPIKTGDHVDVKTRGFRGCGVVEKIHRKGLVDHVDEDMIGTKDDPAARVRLYRAYGDGHMPSGQKRPFKLKELTRRAERFKEPSKKSLPQLATKNSPMGEKLEPAAIEPLRPLIGKSDQQVANEIMGRLEKITSPEYIEERLEKLMGFV